MSKEEEHKVGDLVYIIKDVVSRYAVSRRDHKYYKDKYGYLVGKVGRIIRRGYDYDVEFNDGKRWVYREDEIRKTTQKEHDRYYLERYKYA